MDKISEKENTVSGASALKSLWEKMVAEYIQCALKIMKPP